ncbi:hypothetical protein WMF28_41455 [Sorangium sp. So ce590]|uniref:hypothetical protein n=1 Tax=Sorangium sp. So ce590 TaxID=3133317 RepID=UPI003F621CFF
MVWTITAEKRYEKQLSKAGLMSSEETKLNEWLALVPTRGPFAAATELHIKCAKLHSGGDQWEIYLGSYHRMSFTVNGFEQVELLSVGHT